MSRALNPQEDTPDVGDSPRQTGRLATAGSVNGLILPLAHICGRIVPIYALRAAARQMYDGVGVTVGGWDIGYLPTHGAWADAAETNLNGAVLQAFCGPVTEQFGPAFTINLPIEAVHPSARAVEVVGPGYALEPREIDMDVTWDDLSTTATESETVGMVFRSRSTPRPDPGDVLDAHALARNYGDVGPYNLTCRDVSGAELIDRRPARPHAVQTGETDTEATDTSSHIITKVALGDIGSSSDNARVYAGYMVAHGINSDDVTVASDSSTGWTVIPGVFPFETGVGGGAPRQGQALTQVWRDVNHADRTAFANRGRVVCSRGREDSTTTPMRAYKTADATNWTAAQRGVFRALPGILPGSARVTGAGSGTTLADRGGFRARVCLYNAECKIGVRKVTIAGTYGQTSTFGSWNYASASNATAAFVWSDVTDDATSVADHVLLPSGISPGDDFEVCVWWRSLSGDAYLQAWCVWEPPLSTVAP